MLYERERVVSATSGKSALFGQALTLIKHRLLMHRERLL